jgi:hypothetical protein
MTRIVRAALAAAVLALGAGRLAAAGPAAAATSAPAVKTTAVAAAVTLPGPVHTGTLRIAGDLRDGATVAAAGLSWSAPALPAGWRLVSLEVAYTWQSCAADGSGCRTAAGSAVTPFAARDYAVAAADAGRRLRLTETATEVVVPSGSPAGFTDVHRSVTRLSAARVRAYPAGRAPSTAFVNGTPRAPDRLHPGVPPGHRAARQPGGRPGNAGVPDRPRTLARPAGQPGLLHRDSRRGAAPRGGTHR